MKKINLTTYLLLLVCLSVFGTVSVSEPYQKTSTQVSSNQQELILQLKAENEAMQKRLELRIGLLQKENTKLQHDLVQLADLQHQNTSL